METVKLFTVLKETPNIVYVVIADIPNKGALNVVPAFLATSSVTAKRAAEALNQVAEAAGLVTFIPDPDMRLRQVSLDPEDIQ